MCDARQAALAGTSVAASRQSHPERERSSPRGGATQAAAFRPASERACDLAVAGFAGWTLVCHACVFLGRSLDELALASALALIAAIFAYALRRTRSGGMRELGRSSAGPAPVRVGPRRDLAPCLAALSGVAAAAWILPIDLRVAWTVTAAVLAAAWMRSLRADERARVAEAPHAGRGCEVALWALAAGAALVTLLFVRPDFDDALYVNLATAAIDAPDAPLFVQDTMHGMTVLPLHLPVYRVQSYELLAAVLGRVTRTEAIGWLHLALPALAAALAVLAHARLLRLLAPDRWLGALCVWMLVLLLAGERHRWHGNFAFARMQHGKSVMLSVALPLVMAYALELWRGSGEVRDGGGRAAGWRRLAAAQIAAVGLSVNALWLAPLTAGAALFAGFDGRLRTLRTTAVGFAASIYPLLLGFALRGATTGAAYVPPAPRDTGAWMRQVISRLLGEGAFAASCALAVTSLWWILPPGRARRLALVLPLTFLLLFSPFTMQLVARELTGHLTYWRVFWLLPLPLFLALFLSAPLDPRLWLPRRARVAICAALVISFLAFVPRDRVLSARNRVRFAPLQLAVTPEYHVARSLASLVPPGAPVLASVYVSVWIPTLPHPPRALVVQMRYLEAYAEQLGAADVERRTALALYVSGSEGSATPDDVVAAVEDYGLAAVCLVTSMPERAALVRALERAGFRAAYADGDHEILVR